jgi:hypothetical protein
VKRSIRWPRRAFRPALLVAALAGSAALLISQQAPAPLPEFPQEEVILRAMRDEMQRSWQLGTVAGSERPYYISYSLTDSENLNVASTLGATVNVARSHFRSPVVEVRVGSYQMDNTGHVNSGAYNGTRFDSSWPLEDDYQNLRESFWLSTDRDYKAAIESIGRKRAALNNAAAPPDALPDYSPAPPVVKIPKLAHRAIDVEAWTARADRLSAIFKDYPEVLSSSVNVAVVDGITSQLTSEGTAIRYADGLTWIYGKADGQAPDGMLVHDAVSIQTLEPAEFPPDAELESALTAVAENVRALMKAPPGEAYTGPVLFEPRAAAQLLAQMMNDNLKVQRRPVSEPGRPANILPSEWESRLGGRVLPDFLDVADDPTAKTWNGKPLVGSYEFDMEGVPAKAVNVIEKGILKSFLTTRQPIKGFTGSNGHARLPGNFGAYSAGIANLFVKASESRPLAELRQQMLEMVRQQSRPYGIVVRKLDYPFAGAGSEYQALAQANAQSGGSARPVSPPVLAYRVYPDGREELVRGLRFHGLSTRALRDIVAASSETELFDFVNTNAPLALLGSGGYLAGTAVVSPGLLFEEIEFEMPREQLPKPPTVPPPPLSRR